MNLSHFSYRPYKFHTILWHLLFYTSICYGFHRYIFKYSHGAFAKEGYQQTPLVWQAGKFVLIAVLLGLIYLNSRFATRISVKLLLLYTFLSFVLIVNIGSFLLYDTLLTDELEYLIYALLLLPLCFIAREELQIIENEISVIINVLQYILIGSNAIVIFNYFAFDIIPFHAYRGALMRFGGLWDDPNTFAICSVLFMGYALAKKQYLLVSVHAISVLLTVSFNGYLLLFGSLCYWILGSTKNRFLYLGLFAGLISILMVLVFYNLDYAISIYMAKRESINQHSSIATLTFSGMPFLQPVLFHETWFLSELINYFPFSILFTLTMAVIFVRFLLFETRTIQRLLFILFFITSLFLPFLYMFPINFIALLFLVLYIRGVRF